MPNTQAASARMLAISAIAAVAAEKLRNEQYWPGEFGQDLARISEYIKEASGLADERRS